MVDMVVGPSSYAAVAPSSAAVALRHTSSIGEKMNEASEVRDWSKLPNDPLELIFSLLNIVDRFHAACACKGWHSVARATPRRNNLRYGSPCFFLLGGGEGKTCCYLLDPLCNTKYTIPTPNLPSPVKVLFSKGGWLLMLARDGESVFFFNPLTKATIDLPKMRIATICDFSFSHIPTSPDCFVMAIHAVQNFSCGIFLCRHGSNRWYMHSCKNDFDFTMSHKTPVFHDGRFYCLGDKGNIAIFNPSEGTWAVFEEPQNVRSLTHRFYITESDGELIWVRTNSMGDSVHICKLDSVSNKWKALDSLGGRCLFVSRVISICPKEMATAKRRNGVYFGMIQDDDFLFYSCETRKLHPRGDFGGAKDYSYTSCWIEPVFSHPSSEELKWSELESKE